MLNMNTTIYRATRSVLEIDAFEGEFYADMVRYVTRGEPERNLHVQAYGHYSAWFETEEKARAWLLKSALEDIAEFTSEINKLSNLVATLEIKAAMKSDCNSQPTVSESEQKET